MKATQSWPYCIGGALLFSVSMNLFLVPLHIYSAGFLGIAQLLRDFLMHCLPYQLPFDIAGILNLILNIFMIVLAAKVLAQEFAVHTAVVILFESLFLSVIPVPKTPLVEDVFISVLLGSVLCAYGTRLFFKGRGSGGGIDIIGLYLTKTGKGSVGSVFCLSTRQSISSVFSSMTVRLPCIPSYTAVFCPSCWIGFTRIMQNQPP